MIRCRLIQNQASYKDRKIEEIIFNPKIGKCTKQEKNV